jgi:cytochrome c-type biogenesis protein CcmH
MSWLVSIALAIACFAAIALVFRVPQKGWAIVLAALALGLAGYGLQGSPSLPGAPKAAAPRESAMGGQIIALRRALVGDARKSRDPLTVTADALMRAGQFENSANLFRGVVDKNPADGEAWLALGNALAFHADGLLTPAALYAYDRAAAALPDSPGPAFFVGLSLIRAGKLIEAHKLWTKTLAALPPDAPGRGLLADRLAELDALMRRIAAEAGESGR